MHYLKRSMLSLKRKLVMTVTLFALITLFGTLLSGAISLRNAIYQTELNLRSQIPAVTTLRLNHSEVADVQWEIPTVEMINAVGALPYVLAYDITYESSLSSRELEWVRPFIESAFLPSDEMPQAEIDRIQQGFKDLGGYVENFPTAGINNPNPADLQSGLIDLVSGRFMTQEELDDGAPVAVISRNFAEVNDFKIGDMLSLEKNVYDYDKMLESGNSSFFLYWHLDDYIVASKEFNFQVIGIFDVVANFFYSHDLGEAIAMIDRNSDLHNRIYIPSKISEQIASFTVEHRQFSYFLEEPTLARELFPLATFILNDSRELGDFSEATREILPEFWEVTDLSGAFGQITNSMNSVLGVADFLLWGTSGAMIIILSLSITLFLRDRKHEIGIYRALGERKSHIVRQILFEVLAIFLPAIVLSLFIGNVLSSTISREMIMQDIIRQMTEGGSFMEVDWNLLFFNPGPMTAEEMMASFDTSLNIRTIIIFLTASIIITLVSTVVPILYTMRLEPKQMLM